MQSGHSYSRNEREDCCPECKAPQPPPGELCVRCGRSAVARLADWSDYNCIAGNAVKREDGFDHLLTDYDRVLLQFGMHISWKCPGRFGANPEQCRLRPCGDPAQYILNRRRRLQE
jgi:hypothetical protein